MNDIVTDTLFMSKNIVITKSETTIFSYVDINNLITTFILAFIATFLISIALNFLRGIDKLHNPKFRRSSNIVKGLRKLVWFSWAVDTFFLIGVPGYNISYVFIIVSGSILLYEIIKIIVNLGKVGFEVSKFLRVFSASLKTVVTKDPDSVAEVLNELSQDERFQKGNNNKPTALILLLFLPYLLVSGSINKAEPIIVEKEVIEVSIESYRVIDIGFNGKKTYQIKWIKLNEEVNSRENKANSSNTVSPSSYSLLY